MGNKQAAVIALGMFDGVHLGHRALLLRTIALAEELHAMSMVYTFYNHPRSVFASAPKLLMTAEERECCIRKLGVDAVRMDVFDKTMAALTPKAYIERLMLTNDIRGMIVGFNYSFGSGGNGKAETLHTLGGAQGFCVEIIPPVNYKGSSVSSTRIRELVERGEISEANEMLCMPYSLYGQVVENRHIGTSMGYPTANLLPPEEKALPLSGVYATRVIWNGQSYPAVTNVGNNPTVQGKYTTVESHLIDFAGNLYGESICVEFRAFLRKEQNFGEKEALAKQIEEDTRRAKEFFCLTLK